LNHLASLSTGTNSCHLDYIGRPAGQRACFHGFLPLPFSNFIVTRQFLPFTWIWQKTIPALNRRQLHIPSTVSCKANLPKVLITLELPTRAQEFGGPSLQPSLHRQTHAFFPTLDSGTLTLPEQRQIG